ncbi:DEKNAAC105622 [Brettanomyces naardenensis]|uniref:Amino-acid acetyltransferase, mitochondrial n=1 Tax=Brettanomyces naardenensis TaxID=13370 RepID=A0A448YTK8_BRENA|nr:DEKNAAC105622 [Brettanomyces naardenensis]
MIFWRRPILRGLSLLRYGTTRAISSETVESSIVRRAAEKRDLILTILNSTATKREARYYLKRYPLLDENDIYKNKNRVIDNDLPDWDTTDNGKYDTYIDHLLDGKREDEQSLAAPSPGLDETAGDEMQLTDTIRVMFVRIRNLKKLSPPILQDIGATLSKCMKLGASPILILESPDETIEDGEAEESSSLAIKSMNESCNRLISLLESTCDFRMRAIPGLFQIDSKGRAKFVMQELAMIPLFQGLVPVLTPWVVEKDSSREKKVTSLDIMKYAIESFKLMDHRFKAEHNTENADFVSVEKIVFIDELGGIPSLERYESSHVLINLLQEFSSVKRELLQCNLTPAQRKIHTRNLEEMEQLLTLAPHATGIITTPKIATLEKLRRTTNPIIHNILTDRPTISSSLPVNLKKTPMLNTTIVKKGTPIIVHLSRGPEEGLDLIDMDKKGIIDLAKLKHLIDDSFGRVLDLHHYLNRVNKHVAGLIIAGDYEGGAILSWETPSTDPSRVVAYLDKFAVLKKLQGLPGLADIVFKAMLVNFKEELVWRSRTNNPVNKWYFDRSSANCCIPQTHWRMFYSGRKAPTETDLNDYMSICAAIEPSFKS